MLSSRPLVGRIRSSQLRGLLVAVNLGLLVALTWIGHWFFFGPRAELKVSLTDQTEFVFRPAEVSDQRQHLSRVLATLAAKPPVVPSPPPKVEATPQAPQPGGPIAEHWRILSARFIGDQGFATIQKKEVERGRRTVRRNRSSRRTTRRRRSRRAAVPPTKHVREAATLWIEGKEYFVKDITREPVSIVYSDHGKTFVLNETNESESTLRYESGALILDGKSELEEEQDTDTSAKGKIQLSRRRGS